MTKNDLINDVVAELSNTLDPEQLDRVKITMIVKFHGFEVAENETLPSVVVYDNNYIFKRFTVDCLAKGNKPSTIKTYLNMLKPFLQETGLNYLYVTAQDIIDYIATKKFKKNTRGEYPSQNYIATISRSMFVFFQWAYRKKHLAEDIMRDVDRIKQKQKKKEKLTDEEVESCRNVCKDQRELALFELMMSTGMRVGEISNLKIEDINFITRSVTIFGEKTDSFREGILSIKAKNAIKMYIGDRTAGPLFRPKRKASNQEALGKGTLESIAKKIGEKANAHCKTNVHCYRKTFACILYRKTKDVKLVSVLLGHSSTAVTEKYYLIDDMIDVHYRIKQVA